jgi:hypothetical protein
MRGGNAQRAQHVGERWEAPGPRRTTRTTQPGRAAHRAGSPVGNFIELREARKAKRDEVYRRRRLTAVSLLVLAAVALVFAVFVQTKASDTAERAVPIDPNNAGPDTVLAEAAGVSISTPIRPASLTGLGYHPEGESLAAMDPRGKNLSANAFLGLLSRGETPENIHYYLMDAAGRGGPETGALDVGATTGTAVYAPVTGTVTAIRPDPMVENANVIEIKPDANPDVRVNVSLVRSNGAAGVNDYVTAGITELGTVADSAKVLDPQLSSYTTDAGNHVTVSVSKSG